ncbi:hypothetical protein XENORESO_002933 [Xenotaenia resolanae]|uniref:Uncharacterized protein n=1 Tax=Xenotaenia resolanae TaxID=208358 RepID=A0ABV0VYB2_9TELE
MAIQETVLQHFTFRVLRVSLYLGKKTHLKNTARTEKSLQENSVETFERPRPCLDLTLKGLENFPSSQLERTAISQKYYNDFHVELSLDLPNTLYQSKMCVFVSSKALQIHLEPSAGLF